MSRLARGRPVALGALVSALTVAGCAPDHPSAVVGVRADGCGATAAEGSGAMIADGTVLTAAHTVAGATTVHIVSSHGSETAVVVGLDPTNDLALLRVRDRGIPVLPAASERPPPGSPATVYAWRNGTVRRVDVTIVRPIVISTTDLYAEAHTERPGYQLAGTILPGDSGAAVLVGGHLVGVVWARSSATPGRAYAIDVAALAPDPGADLARCAATPAGEPGPAPP